MLATSAQVSTASEPWLLLPLIYSLKHEGVRAVYDHGLAVRAIQDFYEQFPNGRQDYLEELKELALRLYRKNSQPGSLYFLDKTPRYHLIVNEILEIFPEGKFIFLWRNPLAVVSSIVNSWCKGKWKPNVWHLDLYNGIASLIDAYKSNRNKIHVLQYENLIRNTSEEMKQICGYLSLDYHHEMIDSFQNINLAGKYGDKTGIINYKSVSNDSLDKWKSTYNNPFRRYWASNYIKWLGADNLGIMGYNYNDLMSTLDAVKNVNLNCICSDMIRTIVPIRKFQIR